MILLLIIGYISIEPKCHYLEARILALRGMHSQLVIIWIDQSECRAKAIEGPN